MGNKIATSQIALPKTACDEVNAIAGYDGSITNLSRVTLASDKVFSDGSALELATVTGTVSGGMTAAGGRGDGLKPPEDGKIASGRGSERRT